MIHVNPALGSHPHVADAVGAADGADVVPLVHGGRGANVLDDLGCAADAVESDAGRFQQVSGQFRRLAFVVDGQAGGTARYGLLEQTTPPDAAHGVLGAGQHVLGLAGAVGPDAYYEVALGLLANDGDAAGVPPPVGQGFQHTDELVAHGGQAAACSQVLVEDTANAAHKRARFLRARIDGSVAKHGGLRQGQEMSADAEVGAFQQLPVCVASRCPHLAGRRRGGCLLAAWCRPGPCGSLTNQRIIKVLLEPPGHWYTAAGRGIIPG